MAQTRAENPIQKIVVKIKVGSHRMSATDDPLFLHLHGPSGREFRLLLAHGQSLRKGSTDEYVLGPAGDADTNVEHAELNDPTAPAIDSKGVKRVSIRKGLDPIPNVRGIAELDDRVEILAARVEIHTATDGAPTICYEREGPFWLGLSCGLSVALAPSA